MALGEYVHFRRMRYLEYGVGYKTAEKYVGNNAVRYMIQQRKKSTGNINTIIKQLEYELQKNSKIVMNSDWGSDTHEYMKLRSDFLDECIKTFETGVKPATGLINGKYYDLSTLESQYSAYNNLLAEVDMVNAFAAAGQGISQARLGELLIKYKQLDSELSGDRKSILGKIQQGLNHYAAQVWYYKLIGQLGDVMSRNVGAVGMNVAVKEVNKAMHEAIIKGAVQDVTTNAAIQSFSTTDTLGGIYTIIPSNEGVEFSFQDKRPFVLNDRNKKVNYSQLKSIQWKGQDVNLGILLEQLDTNGRFATHWLNRHAINKWNTGDHNIDDSLKKAVVVQAYRDNHSIGDAIVSIDKQAGNIQSKTIDDLLDMDLSQIVIHEPIEEIELENRWEGKDGEPDLIFAYTRAMNIAAMTHGIMLTVNANLTF